MDELDQFLSFPAEEGMNAPATQAPVLTVEEIMSFDPSSTVPMKECKIVQTHSIAPSPYVFSRSPEIPLTVNLDGFRYSKPAQMIIPELRITTEDDVTFGSLGIPLSHLEENGQDQWGVPSPLMHGSLAPPASPYLTVPQQSIRRDSLSSIHSGSSLIDLDNLDIYDDISEGCLSPSTAISQGWDPQIVCVPSPLISIIPSPMAPIMNTSSASVTPTMLKPILPKTEIPAESMSRFWESNSGLGLVDPNLDLNLVSQDPKTQDSFQKMLVSLGLYPSDDSMQDGEEEHSEESLKEEDSEETPCKQSEKMSSNDTLYERERSASLDSLAPTEKKKPFWTVVKSDRRTLYQCPYPDCLKSMFLHQNSNSQRSRAHTTSRVITEVTRANDHLHAISVNLHSLESTI